MEERGRKVGVGSLFAMAAAALFGASTPFAKKLLDQGRGEMAVAGLLYAGAALGLFVVALFVPAERSDKLTRREWGWLGFATAMGGLVGPALLMIGLRRSGGMAASLLLTVETPATALIAWAAFGERLGWRVVLGTALVVGGAAVMRLGEGARGVTTALGAAAIAGSCVAWALDNNATARIAHRDALRIALFKCACAAPCLLGLAALFDPASLQAWRWSAGSVAAGLLTGLFGYGLSLACFVRALRELGAARTGVLFATAPFVAALVALFLLGEHMTRGLAAAGLLMAMGTGILVGERALGDARGKRG